MHIDGMFLSFKKQSTEKKEVYLNHLLFFLENYTTMLLHENVWSVSLMIESCKHKRLDKTKN